MKPNYLFIGASKCATSSICALLGQHPDIFMVSEEVGFFSLEEVYIKGFDWYESLFDQANNVKRWGEGSNWYTMKELFPETITRIISYVPDAKLIYSVRHPIDRIESYWLEIRSHGSEKVHYDFNRAVELNRDWLIDSSNYWQQISAYRTHFSDDQILVIFYEDFKENPNAVMRRCFEFLEVDPNVPVTNPKLHLNPSMGKKAPIDFLSRLRSYPIYRNGIKLIPKGLRESVREKFLLKRIQGRPQWSVGSRKYVADILEADTCRFLEYYGKPKTFWDLRQ